MASVQEHYDTHLAPLYSWMSGGAAGPRARFAALLAQLGLRPTHPGATALDLGAGNGFQAIPLAQAGYAVTAIDLSAALLRELERDAAELRVPVRAITGDLRAFARHLPSPTPEVITCMGDTLTHLATRDDVRRLITDVSAALAPGGCFIVSFRDYTVARSGADRFIPVRSDAERILTCFLDFTATHVAVHDIVHTREGDGWRQRVSVYQKIRLGPAEVRADLAASGLVLEFHDEKNGLVTLAARRPTPS